MDTTTVEHIIKRLEYLESTQHEILQTIDTSTLPDKLRVKILSEKYKKEKTNESNSTNEWVEKDKISIVKQYNHKQFNITKKQKAIHHYSSIGTELWWLTKKIGWDKKIEIKNHD